MRSLAATFWFAILTLLNLLLVPAWAQGDATKYPGKPITFVIPSPAGGTGDLACRLLIKSAERILGQSILPVNRTGASFTIAMKEIASAKPDGYTIGYTAMLGTLMAPFVMDEQVSYHPLKDFRQLIQFGDLNMAVTVKADSPLRDMRDLIALAREKPGQVTYGTPGITSLGHLTMQQIAKKEGVSFSSIPFRGGPDVQTGVLGGHIMLGTGDFNHSMVQSGQLRILFLIGESRSSHYPTTPIVKELGYDFPVPLYLNVAAPAGTPDDIARQLEHAFEQAMKSEEFIKGMQDLRITVRHRSSQEFTEYMANAYQVYGKLLRDLGLAKPGR